MHSFLYPSTDSMYFRFCYSSIPFPILNSILINSYCTTNHPKFCGRKKIRKLHYVHGFCSSVLWTVNVSQWNLLLKTPTVEVFFTQMVVPKLGWMEARLVQWKPAKNGWPQGMIVLWELESLACKNIPLHGNVPRHRKWPSVQETIYMYWAAASRNRR